MFKSITPLSIINKFSTIKNIEQLMAMNQMITYRYNHADFAQATAMEVIRIDTGERLNNFQIVRTR